MKKFMMLAACAATFYACSSNDVNTPDIDEATTGLLSVSTSVLTQNSKGTKAVGGQDGTDKGPVMGTGLAKDAQIGVFVFNTTKTNDVYSSNFEPYSGATNAAVSGNNAALNQLWTAGTKDTETGAQSYTTANSFILGIQPAAVYAYFPKDESINPTYNSGSAPTIPVTPGYTDYLYGAHGTINNGVITAGTVNSTNKQAQIQLNHALAMISFTFTKGDSYPADEACQVNAITINNLPALGSLNIANGVIAQVTTPTTKTLNISRFNGTAYAPTIGATTWTEWTIQQGENGSYSGNTECNFKPEKAINKDLPTTNILGAVASTAPGGTVSTAPLFHALVLPNTKMPETIEDKTLHAVIKIDGVNYKIALAIGKRLPNNTPSNEINEWAANKHYTYNLTISGKSGQGNELEVSSVTVRQWTAGGSSDIEI